MQVSPNDKPRKVKSILVTLPKPDSEKSPYFDLAKKYISKQPLFFDKINNWWLWDFQECKWYIKDEIDIFIILDKILDYNLLTLKATTKNKILEALKRIGRQSINDNSEKHLIQFKNKIYNIKTRETFEASPQYFITNPIPYELGENEDTPTMDKIFEEWVGKDYVQTLYEIAAYSLLCDYPIHRIFFFIGAATY
jgi:phage/plasmid-associated DNA primase